MFFITHTVLFFFFQEELASRLMNVQASSSALDDVADLNDTFSVSSCEGKWLEGDFWKAGEKAKSEKELREEEELLNAEVRKICILFSHL